ncbi:MAG: IS30 family transposase [Acidobacteria bacterium]|nr:IS30 family transposase [Acidobacteriota bacterium]
MNGYKQLTREQRYQIYALQKEGHSQTVIARNVGVHKATISRERRRNRGARGYRPKQADELATARKQRVRPRITAAQWTQVEGLLRQEWSPAQIAGRLKLEQPASVSHERIYQYIYADKARGGTLYRHLRCQKHRRKRYGSYSRRGQIPNRVTIDQRPEVVAQKARLGDWEADTIIGQNHQQALVSMVERKSKLTRLAKVARNTAELVGHAMTTQLASLVVKTITSDNGREFAHHQHTAAQLKADFYFAHPYSSWERGLNENTNGLVRQYFPKKSEFSKITDRQLDKVVERLNNRPRQTLGYKTPNEVFFKLPLVALTT